MWALLLLGGVALAGWIVYRLARDGGYFDSVLVEVHSKPAIIGKPVEIFYKHHVGAYSKTSKYFADIKSLLPAGAKLIGVYYDNPTEVREELCQAAVGVVGSIDGEQLIEPHYAQNLVRWGYERMSVPAVERAVVTRQRFSGFVSLLHLVNHVYPTLKRFLSAERINIRLTVEICETNNLTVFCPLDHAEEFVVPEVVPTAEVERRLNSGEPQSDLNSATDVSDEGDQSASDSDSAVESES